MAVTIRNGNTYRVLHGDAFQKGVKFGTTSDGKSWVKVILTDKRNMCRVACFVVNKDHGLTDGDDDISVRVDDFCVNTNAENGGITVSKYQSKSGTWYDQITCKGVVLHKVGEAYDGGFESEGGFETTDSRYKPVSSDFGGELPF